MQFYVLYETDRVKFADGYETEQYANEYAKEAKERGYTNVEVLSEEEFVSKGYDKDLTIY